MDTYAPREQARAGHPWQVDWSRWFNRGEWFVAPLGAALAGLLVTVLIVSGWWLMRTQRAALTQAIRSPGAPTADVLTHAHDQLLMGLGLIGVASMGALLLVYHHFRKRSQAAAMIREALLTMTEGEPCESESMLSIAEGLGSEARAWNRLMAERSRLKREAAAQGARQSMGAVPVADNDLVGGCDAMAQGLLMIDEQLRVKYANNAAGLFLRAGTGALVGRGMDEIIEFPEVASSMRAAVTRSQRATHLVDRRARGESKGDEGVLRLSIRPVRRGDACTAMLVIEDVTQQRVAEEARHEFVAQATHELRTPLTNVRLYLEMLLDGEDKKDPAIRAKCLNVINAEIGRLERMVGDMLSVAQIEAGALKVEHDDVRIDELLQAIEQDYRAQAGEKEVDLTFKLPPKLPVIQGDRDKLMLAVQNVVGNALKYTPKGGKITVSAQADARELTVEVADTGMGIAPEDAERVFEKFYRVHDERTEGVPGSGLGLALSREVVRLHGGDITVDSQVGHGSTFSITIPARGE